MHPPIFLLRHGETTWNRAGRLQGHLDSDLTQKGRMQAEAQGAVLEQVFKSYPEADVYTSPLGRARDTADIALPPHERRARLCDDLREITAGSWDGMLLDDIQQADPLLFNQARNAFELMFLAPDGEGQTNVLARVQRVLAILNGPSVLITHGATLCVLRGVLRGMAFEDMLNLSHEQGCVYALENGVETILRSCDT